MQQVGPEGPSLIILSHRCAEYVSRLERRDCEIDIMKVCARGSSSFSLSLCAIWIAVCAPHGGRRASLCSIPTHTLPPILICTKHTQQSRRQQAKTPTLLNLPIVHYITTTHIYTQAPLLSPHTAKKNTNRNTRRRRHRFAGSEKWSKTEAKGRTEATAGIP
jgi:hypothetical protein